MTTAGHLEAATIHLDAALAELEAAKDDVPSYAVQAIAFLTSDLRATIRRLENCRRALGGSTRPVIGAGAR